LKVVVTGSRYWLWENDIKAAIFALPPNSIVVHGGSGNADRLAGKYAREAGHDEVIYRANWKKYKRKAGPIRNSQMLDEAKPDKVLAFRRGGKTSKGTTDCIEKAKARGILVEIVERCLEGFDNPLDCPEQIALIRAATKVKV
jgi:hypothetical protein